MSNRMNNDPSRDRRQRVSSSSLFFTVGDESDWSPRETKSDEAPRVISSRRSPASRSQATTGSDSGGMEIQTIRWTPRSQQVEENREPSRRTSAQQERRRTEAARPRTYGRREEEPVRSRSYGRREEEPVRSRSYGRREEEPVRPESARRRQHTNRDATSTRKKYGVTPQEAAEQSISWPWSKKNIAKEEVKPEAKVAAKPVSDRPLLFWDMSPTQYREEAEAPAEEVSKKRPIVEELFYEKEIPEEYLSGSRQPETEEKEENPLPLPVIRITGETEPVEEAKPKEEEPQAKSEEAQPQPEKRQPQPEEPHLLQKEIRPIAAEAQTAPEAAAVVREEEPHSNLESNLDSELDTELDSLIFEEVAPRRPRSSSYTFITIPREAPQPEPAEEGQGQEPEDGSPISDEMKKLGAKGEEALRLVRDKAKVWFGNAKVTISEWETGISQKASEIADHTKEKLQQEAQARAERKAQQEAEAKAEAERIAQQEAEAKAEAERIAQQEAEARAEAERIAQEDNELHIETWDIFDKNPDKNPEEAFLKLEAETEAEAEAEEESQDEREAQSQDEREEQSQEKSEEEVLSREASASSEAQDKAAEESKSFFHWKFVGLAGLFDFAKSEAEAKEEKENLSRIKNGGEDTQESPREAELSIMLDEIREASEEENFHEESIQETSEDDILTWEFTEATLEESLIAGAEAEEPGPREAIPAEPAAQESSAKETSAEKPAAQESSAKETSAEEPAAQESSAKETSAEKPAAQEPTAEEPAIIESSVQEAAKAEEAARTEEPAKADEPAKAEEPAKTEEPASDAPAPSQQSESTDSQEESREAEVIPIPAPAAADPRKEEISNREKRRRRRERREKKKAKAKFNWRLPAMFIASIAMIVLGYYYAQGFMHYSKYFYEDTSIGAVNVSGMTAEQAENKIMALINNYALDINGFHVQDVLYPEDVGLEFELTDYDGKGRIEKTLKRQNAFLWPILSRMEHKLEALPHHYSNSKLDAAMGKIKCVNPKVYTAPKNACLELDPRTHAFVIKEDEPANRADRAIVKKQIEDALESWITEINIPEEAYVQARIRANDPRLVKLQKETEKYMVTDITLEDGDKVVKVDRTVIPDFLDIDQTRYTVELNEEAVKNFINTTLDDTFDTLGRPRTVTTELSGTFTVSGGDYGKVVSTDEELPQLMEEIRKGMTLTREPFYRSDEITDQNGGIGYTYVDVNLSMQTLSYVSEGREIMTSYFVSGKTSDGHGTPEGTYSIQIKATEYTMVKYNAFVHYWMNFYPAEGVGFHDATWRGSFGGNIYKYSGSHGCINMPLSKAKELYGYISYGTPVVVHY